jgi:DNA-directed RNA polymerase subunit RPC12/RpoP
METSLPPAKLTCPQCRSRLTILETHSGGRIVSVAVLGLSVERSAKAFESFMAPGGGPDIQCPACESWIDPSGLRGYKL